MIVKLTVPGKPMAKQSFRYFTHEKSKTVIKYQPKEIVEYQNYIKMCYFEAYPKHLDIMLRGALKMVIVAYLQIPLSASKKKRDAMNFGEIVPEIKPDYENIGKIVGDALKRVAYPDDKYIADGHVIKRYSYNPRLEITIEEIFGDSL